MNLCSGETSLLTWIEYWENVKQYFQAEYAAALIAGKFQLPTQGDMLKSWLKYVYELQSKGKKIVDVNFLDNLQVRSGQRKRNMGTENQVA